MKTITKCCDRDVWWRKNSFWVNVALVLLILMIFLDLPALCQAHEHHEHDARPSFKYSKEANENFESVHEHQHQHHHHHHNHHHHEHQHKPGAKVTVEDKGNVFLNAMGSTLLISVAPFVILFFVPLDNTKEKEPLLKILLSFASGGLLGDAFLHLIPHALVPHSHNNGHSHNHDHEDHSHGHDMSVGLCVLLGIIIFLVVEKAIRLVKGGHSHSHSHSVVDTKNHSKKERQSKSKSEDKNSDKEDDGDDEDDNQENEDDTKAVESAQDNGEIKIAGYLNLAADFLHNFTDGLAIGASYLAGKNVGYVTTFTILLHEVPHEIGDFAILIQSGCSKKKAMLLQLTTAVGALCGTYVSLLAGGMGDVATAWILPFTAGGFIYIATVSVIPELLSDTKFWQSIKEIVALLAGVYMMVLIAEYE